MVAVGFTSGENCRQDAKNQVSRGRARRVAALLVGALSFFGGCGANNPTAYRMTAATYQAAPTALDDVRRIGLVQAEGSVEVDIDDSTQVTNTFVIDVGAASANAATAKAARLLRERGWEIIGKERPWFVTMKSTKWDAFLAIDSFQPTHLASHPDILKTLKEKSAKTEASVIINVEAYMGE